VVYLRRSWRILAKPSVASLACDDNTSHELLGEQPEMRYLSGYGDSPGFGAPASTSEGLRTLTLELGRVLGSDQSQTQAATDNLLPSPGGARA
jgi:hypothetical protein